MSSPTPIITPPPTRPASADEPDGAPITVQPVKVAWWKRWSTQLAAINLAAIVTSIRSIPDRILDAIPTYVYGAIGVALLAVILIPAATSIKQVKKVDKS